MHEHGTRYGGFKRWKQKKRGDWIAAPQPVGEAQLAPAGESMLRLDVLEDLSAGCHVRRGGKNMAARRGGFDIWRRAGGRESTTKRRPVNWAPSDGSSGRQLPDPPRQGCPL